MSKTAVVTGRPVNLFGHQPIKTKPEFPHQKKKRSKIPKETLTPKISACLIEFIDFDFFFYLDFSQALSIFIPDRILFYYDELINLIIFFVTEKSPTVVKYLRKKVQPTNQNINLSNKFAWQVSKS